MRTGTCHGRRGLRGVAVGSVALMVSTLASCAGRSSGPAGVPAPYLTTRDQVGHELVKTEQFIVPVGTSIRIAGLEFRSLPCALTSLHERILRQVFNSLEEITENTVNDQDPARVAEFRKMEFEVRGYSAASGHPDLDEANSKACAEVAMAHLTNLGTPAWRLKAKGLDPTRPGTTATRVPRPRSGVRVEFVRTK